MIACPPGFSVVKLDKTIHDRDSFSCGEAALDNFLRLQAAQDQEKGLSATHVLLKGVDPPIVGYHTLTPYSVPLGEAGPHFKRLSSRIGLVHAILLGRLAVSLDYQGQELGKFLLMHALHSALEASSLVGSSAVFVDSKPGSLAFYSKYGFHPTPSNPHRLYLPMKTIASLFEE